MNLRDGRHRRGRLRVAVAALFAFVVSVSWSAPAGGVANFGDVADGQYYTRAVQWMVDEAITNGTSVGCFSPADPVTRGQVAAFMWRMEGSPVPASAHGFVDVLADWQQDAVAWMAENGITKGFTATTFRPDDILTRGQAAALLHRLEGSPGAGGHPFSDVVAGWQQAPVAWMVAESITMGMSATSFAPEATVTRAQLATFLYRYQKEPAVTVDPASPICATSGTGGSATGASAPGGPGAPPTGDLPSNDPPPSDPPGNHPPVSGSATGGSGSGVTYFVDVGHPGASDANPGTESAPWASIVHAADSTSPGDVVWVKAGLYDQGKVNIRHSDLVLSAYPGDEREAIIRGFGISSHENSDLTINGFKLENTPGNAIIVIGPDAENIVISNNHTYNTWNSGISVRGVSGHADPGNYDHMRNVTVVGNLLELGTNGGNSEIISVGSGVIDIDVAFNELRLGDPLFDRPGDEGIAFKNGIRDSRIFGNVIHDLSNKGIHIDGGSTYDPLITNIEIFGNHIYDMPDHAIWVVTEGVGDVDGVHIHDNIIHDIEEQGILVYDHPNGASAGGTVHNILIEHNTVSRAGTSSNTGFGGIRVNHEDATVTIRDNLSWANPHFDIRGDDNTTIDASNLCRESVCAFRTDPLFVDAANDNFALRAGSPAIGAATDGTNLGAR